MTTAKRMDTGIILFQLPDIPVVLGPVGTVLAAVVILMQTAVTFFNWRRSQAVKILKDELDIYKGKVGRLEGEVRELTGQVKEIGIAEGDCRKRLEKLTALYLESKGQEEDERKRRR